MRTLSIAALFVFLTSPAYAEDIIRLANGKFVHFGAVSYMKEIAHKYGVKIEEKLFPKAADIYPAIAAGSFDASAGAVEAAISARGNGLPIVLVSGVANGAVRLLIPANSPVTAIKELKGKTVAATRGGTLDLLLFAELEKHGLTWSTTKGAADVHVLFMQPPELNQALMSQQVDAINQSEPYAAMIVRSGAAKELLRPYDTVIGRPTRVLIVTDKLHKENPALVEKLIRILAEATEAFRKDPALAEKYTVQTMFGGAIEGEDYRAAMENVELSINVDAKQVETTTTFMVKYEIGKMITPPKIDDWVKLDLLERVKTAQSQ